MSQTFSQRMKQRHVTIDTKEPQFDISKIEGFFKDKILPKEIRLDENTLITDPARMIQAHINFLRGKEKKPTYLCYYERLKQLINLI